MQGQVSRHRLVGCDRSAVVQFRATRTGMSMKLSSLTERQRTVDALQVAWTTGLKSGYVMCGESCGDPEPVNIGGASLLEIFKHGNEYDKRTLKETDFQTYVADSVNETFADLFGENVRSSIYRYLEESFSIPREEIPDRIHDFESAMDKMLGGSSKTLGKVVIRKLSIKVGLPMDENNQYGLTDFVFTAKKSLLAKFSDPSL